MSILSLLLANPKLKQWEEATLFWKLHFGTHLMISASIAEAVPYVYNELAITFKHHYPKLRIEPRDSSAVLKKKRGVTWYSVVPDLD